MKILILGTSNSIIRSGWIKGFRSEMPRSVSIENKSVGNSPGTQFGQFCTEDLSQYDFVIFDSIVNDENLQRFVGSRDFYRRMTYEILSTISSRTNLITLGFCNERYFENRSWVYNFQKYITNRVGGIFCSAADFAADLTKPFFKDSFHIRLDYARAFGRYLAARIMAINTLPRSAISFHQCFSQIDVTLHSSSEVFSGVNSLTSENFAILKPGDSVSWSSDRGLLVGFKLDTVRTYGGFF